MIALNLCVWILLILFFVAAGAVLAGTYRGDGMVTTDRAKVLALVVRPRGTDPAPAMAALGRQDYPPDLLDVAAVETDGDFERDAARAAAGRDAELVLVLDARSAVGPRWVARCAACFIPGVALVRCGRSGPGLHGLDLALTQAVEAGLTGLGARLLPECPGFGVRARTLARGDLESGETVRFTRLRGTGVCERDARSAYGVRGLAAWYRRICRASAPGAVFVSVGGAALAGCVAAVAAGGMYRWQAAFAFFYAALLFGTVLLLYLRGVSFLRAGRQLGAVVPHALRWCALSLPAFVLLLFSRPVRRP